MMGAPLAPGWRSMAMSQKPSRMSPMLLHSLDLVMIGLLIIKIVITKRFPAHDELGTCRTRLVSPEQPVLYKA